MATDKQIAANRRNAQSSTGPTSAAGKARASLNALTSGIYAESILLPEENADQLRTLIAEYYTIHAPVTPAARAAIDNMIRAEWISRRLYRIDTQILTHEINTLWKPVPGCTSGQAFNNSRTSMHKVQQRITAIDNVFHRNLRAYERLQPDLGIQQEEPAPEPTQITGQTAQMGSFPKDVPTDPKGHPVFLEHCPVCSNLNYRSPSCRYDVRRAS